MSDNAIKRRCIFDKKDRHFYFENDTSCRFKTLAEALESITDASESKPYVIELYTDGLNMTTPKPRLLRGTSGSKSLSR